MDVLTFIPRIRGMRWIFAHPFTPRFHPVRRRPTRRGAGVVPGVQVERATVRTTWTPASGGAGTLAFEVCSCRPERDPWRFSLVQSRTRPRRVNRCGRLRTGVSETETETEHRFG